MHFTSVLRTHILYSQLECSWLGSLTGAFSFFLLSFLLILLVSFFSSVIFLLPWQSAPCLFISHSVLCLCSDLVLGDPPQALLRLPAFKWTGSLASGYPLDPLLIVLSGHFYFYGLQLPCSPVPPSTTPLCPPPTPSALVKSSARVLAFVLKAAFWYNR